MKALTVSFVAGLAFNFRPLLGLLEEHLDDNFQQILPHLLMSDYCRFILNWTEHEEWIIQFLNYLEQNFDNQNEEISELIAVSFIENMPFRPNEQHWAVLVLGEKMKRQHGIIWACK